MKHAAILLVANVTQIVTPCVRCNSTNVKPYGAARFYCLNCGFTWMAGMRSEVDELANRLLNSLKPAQRHATGA